MPRGRPPLRIGAHGKITRAYLGGGVWMARCRYRDSDGVTWRVERRGPPDEHDQHGKLAEDALIEALAQRRRPQLAPAIDSTNFRKLAGSPTTEKISQA